MAGGHLFASFVTKAWSPAIITPGEVPEWTNGAVSKTVVVLRATVGSNPTLSAELRYESSALSAN